MNHLTYMQNHHTDKELVNAKIGYNIFIKIRDCKFILILVSKFIE